MKCICCGKDFEGDFCPACQFPVYEIIGEDADESEAQIGYLAEKHRENYLESVQIGVVTYKWEERNETIVEYNHQIVWFDFDNDWLAGTQWLPGEFAKNSVDDISVTLVIKKGNYKKEHTVDLPNLTQPELQKLGICWDSLLNIRLLLKNSSNHTESEPFSIAIDDAR